MAELSREGRREPDISEFKRTVGLAILFHTAEKLYGNLGFTGYRANVITYTVARLSQMLRCRLAYNEIWQNQKLPDELVNALKILLVGVRDQLINQRPPNTNISEWCKKDQCWSAVLEREFDVELPDAKGWPSNERRPTEVKPEDESLIESIRSIPADVWFSLAKWAKETNTLYPSQRAISFSIGQIIARGGSPTPKQSLSAQTLLNRARQLGFAHPLLQTEHIQKMNDAASISADEA